MKEMGLGRATNTSLYTADPHFDPYPGRRASDPAH